MLSTFPASIALLGLLPMGVRGWPHDENHAEHASTVTSKCTANSTIYDLVTVFDTTTVEATHYVTVNSTYTSTIEESIIENTTTTHIISVTDTVVDIVTLTATDWMTVTNTATNWTTVTGTEIDSVTRTNTEVDTVTVTDTETDSTTIINTETDSTTVTDTETDSTTVTNTETDSTTTTNTLTKTVFSTTFDPCPTECSISAGTVSLFFWPTARPYTYPSTYVDEKLGYTFTSPSVYMLIPTAVGINNVSQTTGPSTASWILPLHLSEVSTIAPAPPGATDVSVTRQLTLNDLGTDCAPTVDPTAIATLVDSGCDPILAAPKQVRSWAYPCNACGRFGLFDPPYAIPTITGGLIPPPTSTVTASLPPPITSVTPTPTSTVLPGTSTISATSSPAATTSVATAAGWKLNGSGEGKKAWLGVGLSLVVIMFLQ